MEIHGVPIHLIKSVISCLLIIIITSVTVTHGEKFCYKCLDLAIAIDITSSQSTSSFDAVKAEVKGIVSAFIVGQDKTRLALIGVSRTATVVANFKDVNSLSDFNAAVDSLTFSTDIADLSEGIKVAKESVLSTARADKVSKVLVLVKDRRSGSAAVSDAPALSRVTSEAAAVKTLGAAINAVGVGGLWSMTELRALFGPDYLLFINKNKALESVKSLNYQACADVCPDSGKSFDKPGFCFKSGKHVLKSVVLLRILSSGLPQCAKEITREFVPCTPKHTCSAVDRRISACNSAGKVTIENIWQVFSSKLQSCVTTTDVQNVDCKDAQRCIGQVAEVFFALDRSDSVGREFYKLKEAAKLVIQSLPVGKDNVRVGLISFNTEEYIHLRLEKTGSMADVLRSIDHIHNHANDLTFTDVALKTVREQFAQNARPGVPRFLFLITDGASVHPDRTVNEIALIKNAGVTLYAVGVGGWPNRAELSAMTAPFSDTNTFYVGNFNQLRGWAEAFTKRICVELSPPHPRLCDDQVVNISISECIAGMQLVSKTEYVYDAARKCVKSTQSTVHKPCRETCTDPINGNVCFLGDKWSTLCHEFECTSGANPLVPQRTSCLAADGSCKVVGSPPFACRDEAKVEISKCQCVLRNGKVTMVIELVT